MQEGDDSRNSHHDPAISLRLHHGCYVVIIQTVFMTSVVNALPAMLIMLPVSYIT